MNPYTSMWTGVHDGDGPAAFHLVLLDNGRTAALADPVGREALRCIRCSACLNVCPVYERVGGVAYGSVYPGPIGAILVPRLRGIAGEVEASLPYASTLCGACAEVCPVKIDIPAALLDLRARAVEAGRGGAAQRVAMRAATTVLRTPRRFRAAQRLAGITGRVLGRWLARPRGPAAGWTRARDVPVPPPESFRRWWAGTVARSSEEPRASGWSAPPDDRACGDERA
ncbi:MAG: 4Fe-4S dicluster domain-containing protein [Micromonosporaceae bacterium]